MGQFNLKAAEKSRAEAKFILEVTFLGHSKRGYRASDAHGFTAVVFDLHEINALAEPPPPGLYETSYFPIG